MPVEPRDPERRRDDERAADRLDRAWDALVVAGRAADQPNHPGGPPDPLLIAVHRFHALDDTPAPDPDFTAQLGRQLTGTTSERRSTSGTRLGLLPALRRPAWVQVAASIVFVAALASGHLGGGDGVPAVSASPTFVPYPTATALSRTACRTDRLGDGATDVAAEMIPAPTSAPCRDGGD